MARFLLLTTFYLLSSIVMVYSESTCGPRFPDTCFCGPSYYDNKVQYIVNCTNTGFTNTSVLEFMPSQTQVLIFTGNKISELPWNVFGAINDYNNLEIIDMSNNHIHEIRGKTYHHVSNVRRLILNHNNLSISRRDDVINHHHPRVFSNFLSLEELHLTDAFLDNTSSELSTDLHDIFVNSNLTELRKLHLEQNEIEKFKDENVFCDLPMLSDLHLGDNNLKEINFDVLCLKHLRFLDLQRNKFENLRKVDLQLLDRLEEDQEHHKNAHLVVDFNLNPFVCDCRINLLHLWMKKTTVTVRNKETLMCYHNRTLPAESIESIQFTNEHCKGLPDEYNYLSFLNFNQGSMNNHNENNDYHELRTIVLVFLMSILCFILFGLLITLIYLNRFKIKHLITPVLDTVSKKVQYTTIKDEECPEVYV